ncbi:UNVERIFIED_CONTAM: hypothetical protein Slati_3871000 [Sesamum latifolium]|uniref:Endonuclease/exonuclease/phosphatase domain-containing protein n=1 Tax=Sesamum latifolium TaxID=2727402 RepID=A0AAW2TPR9_9LAMI
MIIVPTREGVIQTDEEEVVRRVACHRHGRSMGDGLASYLASSDPVERRDLWDALRAVSVDASPWIVGGDFNTVLCLEERSGGAAPSSVAMSDFHDVIADCALVDAGYTGSPYTWYSRRLRQRLDWVLVSSCWIDIFPKMQVTHLELSKLDHRGLLVEESILWNKMCYPFGFSTCGPRTQDFLMSRVEIGSTDAWEWYGSDSAELIRLKYCLKD